MTVKKTHDEFVKDVLSATNGEYVVMGEYKNSSTPVYLKHNVCDTTYLVRPSNFLKKNGTRCPVCNTKTNIKKTHDEFVKEIFKLVGDEYTVLGKYSNNKEKLEIKHNLCGNVYDVAPVKFTAGRRCPKCVNDSMRKGHDKFLQEVFDMVGDEYKVLTEYTKIREKIEMKHNVCGNIYTTTPGGFLFERTRCPKCAGKNHSVFLSHTHDQFINRVKEEVGDEYSILGQYISSKTKVRFVHNSIHCNHFQFDMKPSNFLNDHQRCPKCALGSHKSLAESEVVEFIKDIYNGEIITSDRIILGGKEIDVYIPDLNIGFEYNGYYWHSDKFISKDYHLEKRELALSKGIHLYFIDEIDWINKKDICKARIMYAIGSNSNSIYARRTKVYIPSSYEEREFLNRNHIQGYIPSSLKVALKYDNKIVAILSFIKPRKNVNRQGDSTSLELLRFATDIDVHIPGGFSKLLKHSIPLIQDKFPNVTQISTFSDNNLSYGNLYEKNGFTLDHTSRPSYHYVYRGKKHNRFSFRKSELKSMFPEYYDPELTEFQITDQVANLHRVWNTGNNVYLLEL